MDNSSNKFANSTCNENGQFHFTKKIIVISRYFRGYCFVRRKLKKVCSHEVCANDVSVILQLCQA